MTPCTVLIAPFSVFVLSLLLCQTDLVFVIINIKQCNYLESFIETSYSNNMPQAVTINLKHFLKLHP